MTKDNLLTAESSKSAEIRVITHVTIPKGTVMIIDTETCELVGGERMRALSLTPRTRKSKATA